MTIESLGRSSASQPDPRRTDAAGRGAAVTPTTGSADRARTEAAAADTVELSPEALALAAADVPSNEIEPIRLRDITRKIGNGEYEAPPTLDILTDRLLQILRGGT